MSGSIFFGSPIAIAAGVCLTVLLGIVCVSDARSFRIPNTLVALLAGAGIAYACIRPGPLGTNLTHAVEGLAVGFVLWIPIYMVHWLGAGDVKLFAAASLWLGPADAVNAAIVAAIVGGVISLIWMVRTYGVKNTAVDAALVLAAPTRGSTLRGPSSGRTRLPYGVALAIGVLAVAWFPNAFLLVGHAAQ